MPVGSSVLAPALEQIPLEQPDEGIRRLAQNAEKDDREEQPIDTAVLLRIDQQIAQTEGRREQLGGHEEQPGLRERKAQTRDDGGYDGRELHQPEESHTRVAVRATG